MKNNKNSIVGIIITIVILICLVVISNIKIDRWSITSNNSSSVVLPVQNAFTYIKNKLAGNESFFADIETVKTENQELKQRNDQLEKLLREMELLKTENANLKNYLNIAEKYSEFKTIPADVIQRDLTNYSKIIVINAGTEQGIDCGMAVISNQGLVGHVISTTSNSAKVQTITDTATTVSSTISTTRDSIIARGSLDIDNTLKATYIPTDANLLEGDNDETSGLGGIYPKGIHIGVIKQIVNTKNITDRYAIIQPAVDFAKLETVLIIKSK